MRVLVAEDEAVSRLYLAHLIEEWGHEAVVAGTGPETLEILNRPEPPPLGLLDWMMPGIDGTEIIRAVRASPRPSPPYLILVTSKGRPGDVVEGLTAGANDYLTKPFEENELRARLEVGVRVVLLQKELERRVLDLEEALRHVRRLQGILPICAYCKRIRDDRDSWHAVEAYISEHSDAEFSHGICDDCCVKHFGRVPS